MALETAIVTYVPADGENRGLTVDLIGATHVGEKSYYEQLNRHFAEYGAVLYELVAAEDTRPKPGEQNRPSTPIGVMQRGMKSMLKLSFQLDEIDYTKDNFVHADMSPEEFAQSMRDRQESFLQMFLHMMGQSIALQSEDPTRSTDAELLLALFSKDRELRLKRIMAEQMERMGGLIVFGGPDGSTLITQRNKRALEVLRAEIKAGRKRIGIFYGAGHLPDLDRRLREQFNLKRASQRWLVAWDLTGK